MTRDQLPTVGDLLQMQALLLEKIESLERKIEALPVASESPYMTAAEARAYLRIKSPATFRDRCRAAGIKPVKSPGGKMLYKREDIEMIICK